MHSVNWLPFFFLQFPISHTFIPHYRHKYFKIDVFDAAKTEILTLMAKDSFKRFQTSETGGVYMRNWHRARARSSKRNSMDYNEFYLSNVEPIEMFRYGPCYMICLIFCFLHLVLCLIDNEIICGGWD